MEIAECIDSRTCSKSLPSAKILMLNRHEGGGVACIHTRKFKFIFKIKDLSFLEVSLSLPSSEPCRTTPPLDWLPWEFDSVWLTTFYVQKSIIYTPCQTELNPNKALGIIFKALAMEKDLLWEETEEAWLDR